MTLHSILNPFLTKQTCLSSARNASPQVTFFPSGLAAYEVNLKKAAGAKGKSILRVLNSMFIFILLLFSRRNLFQGEWKTKKIELKSLRTRRIKRQSYLLMYTKIIFFLRILQFLVHVQKDLFANEVTDNNKEFIKNWIQYFPSFYFRASNPNHTHHASSNFICFIKIRCKGKQQEGIS